MSEAVSGIPDPLRILVDATTLRSGGGPIIAAHEIRNLQQSLPQARIFLVDGPNGLPLSADLSVEQVPRPAIDPAEPEGFLRWALRDAAQVRRDVGAHAYLSFTNWLPAGLDVPSALYLHSPYAMQLRMHDWRHFPARVPRFLASQWALARTDAVVVQTGEIGEQVRHALTRLRPVVPASKDPALFQIRPTGSWMDNVEPDKQLARELQTLRGEAQLWLFYPSIPWAHKNMDGLARALRLVAQAGLHVGLILPAGGITPEDLGPEPRPLLRTYGGLTHPQMVACYDFADAVIFPSLLETAGLGLVEALWRRRPLLASRRSFVDELCGEAALRFDPESPRDMADCILAFARDPQAQQQAQERARRWRDERSEQSAHSWRKVFEHLFRAR